MEDQMSLSEGLSS